MTEKQITDLERLSQERGHPLNSSECIGFLRAREILAAPTTCVGLYENINRAKQVVSEVSKYLVNGSRYNRIDVLMLSTEVETVEETERKSSQ